jgi:hypothetical protein
MPTKTATTPVMRLIPSWAMALDMTIPFNQDKPAKQLGIKADTRAIATDTQAVVQRLSGAK